MSIPVLLADIIFPLPVNQAYTYRIPSEMENLVSTGQRVIVQFGPRKYYTGIIKTIYAAGPVKTTLKDILSILDEKPIVNETQLKFWEWMSDYYMCPVGEVYRAAVPAGLRLESESCLFPNDQFDPDRISGEKLKLLMGFIMKNPGLNISKLIRIYRNQNIFPDIRHLVECNAIYIKEEFIQGFRAKTMAVVFLNPGLYAEQDFQRALNEISRASKQTRLLKWIGDLSMEKSGQYRKVEIPLKSLSDRFGQTLIKSLLKRGFIIREEKEISPVQNGLNERKDPEILSDAQQTALEAINKIFNEKDVALLHGVTSSGKTEIYIHLIREVIARGQQALYLLPEIALTSQIINRLQRIFGNEVGIYHSRFPDRERIEIYNRMAGNDKSGYKIILGVRSAVFLPFRDLGLIIVDEEHENTYKQFDPAPRYNARDSSIVLASLYKAKVLLGTATPSVETYMNCINGKYEKVVLNERYRNIMLPEIIVSDINEARKRRTMRSLFTPALISSMETTFNKGKQVILFQNRRGYSFFVECGNCGWIPKCKKCDVSLIYHRTNESLVCHYCGYSRKMYENCDQCGSTRLMTKGFGTERIEDEIGLIFPGIKTARLDLDTTRSRNSYIRILDDFAKGRIHVLIGTQMISKGLDFENVMLVGIVDADQMLNYPDFRAYERSFQLMAQVSGRAGRKDERGKVIIQTLDPANPVIRFVRENDYESMFREQIRERQIFRYPPFVRLIKISLRHRDRLQVEKDGRTLADELRILFGERVFGPQAPIVGRISNYYITEIYLKIEKQSSFAKAKVLLRNAIGEASGKNIPKSTRIILDVDPI